MIVKKLKNNVINNITIKRILAILPGYLDNKQEQNNFDSTMVKKRGGKTFFYIK